MSALPRREAGRDAARFGPDPRRAVPAPRGPGTPPRPGGGDRVAELEAELAAARRRADDAEQALAAHTGTAPEGSFGMRAERLLRLAESEARAMRSAAARDATALLERTQAEAETHRHGVEQELIARTAAFDRETAARVAEVTAREKQLADDLDAHRHQVDRIRSAAAQDADRIRRQAAADAERTRAVAEEAGRQLRAEAQAEADRLLGVQHQARDEMRQLGRTLAAALGGQDAAAGKAADPATSGAG